MKLTIKKSGEHPTASDLVGQVLLQVLRDKGAKIQRSGDTVQIDGVSLEKVKGVMDWVFHNLQGDLRELQELLPDSLKLRTDRGGRQLEPVRGWYDLRVEAGSSHWWGLFWARQLVDHFQAALTGKTQREEAKKTIRLRAKAKAGEIKRAAMVATNRVREEMQAVFEELGDPGIQLEIEDPLKVATRSLLLQNRTIKWYPEGTSIFDSLWKSIGHLIAKRFAAGEAEEQVAKSGKRRFIPCPFSPGNIIAIALDDTDPGAPAKEVFVADNEGRVCRLNLSTISTEQQEVRRGLDF